MNYVSRFDELLDLNALHNWPIKKQLTPGDVKSGRLIMPVHDVENYIMPRLPVDKSERLSRYRGRIVIDVYDVEREIRYNMELVRKMNGRYSLEDWDQVTLTRHIQAGKGIGMSWVNGMLFFRILSD
ncbi:hypothetical protein SADUNF_Sadunf12G0033100 [Salix dunnii]|uniref:Uncharacterized protein n=1 Tax=Salix dunnii TaxID=1413687 RepID=A0A835MS16_9ROSI|nr:hypothetical protein SADUNF_Sadunf12G0033100 [Salix dunnii]